MSKSATYESRTERAERAWLVQSRERALPALRTALALPDLADVSARHEGPHEDAPRVF
jgi:hypothetical protein